MAMGGKAAPQDHSRITGLDSRTIDMSVSCGADGVTVRPGGKFIPKAAFMADDTLMVRELRGIVSARYDAAPGMGLRPKLRFLVKPGGESVYLRARTQFGRSGTPWPVTLQMADRATVRPFQAEDR